MCSTDIAHTIRHTRSMQTTRSVQTPHAPGRGGELRAGLRHGGRVVRLGCMNILPNAHTLHAYTLAHRGTCHHMPCLCAVCILYYATQACRGGRRWHRGVSKPPPTCKPSVPCYTRTVAIRTQKGHSHADTPAYTHTNTNEIHLHIHPLPPKKKKNNKTHTHTQGTWRAATSTAAGSSPLCSPVSGPRCKCLVCVPVCVCVWLKELSWVNI